MAGEKPGSYAGRWVARLRGRVIAQGGTPEQARRAARSRFKETPEILFMPTASPLHFSPILETARKAFPKGPVIYLVGGAVRDALLGRQTHDLDFALEREAIKVARRVADSLNANYYPLDPERDTGRVIITDQDGSRSTMDFAAFRGNDLESDLLGRDFTLNAIAYDPADGSIHDPLGGTVDLKENRLRACSPSSFTDDPVRILRGIRLAADFGFHILPETRAAMKKAAGLLDECSPERLRDELFRILGGSKPAACLRALDHLGALEKVIPEITAMKGCEQNAPHVHDVWEHTLAVVGHLEKVIAVLSVEYDHEKGADLFNGLLNMRIGRYRQQIAEHLAAAVTTERPRRPLLYLAALLHDAAKPHTGKKDEEGQLRFWEHDQQGAEMAANRARLLVLSNDEIAWLETIIRNHMRILFHTNRLLREGKPPSRRAIYRLFRDSGQAGVDLCLLALADQRATYEQEMPQENWAACLDVVRAFLEAWFEKREEQVNPPPLVDGNDLMRELSLQPGPDVGKLIEAIREGQAVGKVSSPEEAYALAREILENG